MILIGSSPRRALRRSHGQRDAASKPEGEGSSTLPRAWALGLLVLAGVRVDGALRCPGFRKMVPQKNSWMRRFATFQNANCYRVLQALDISSGCRLNAALIAAVLILATGTRM